jgi:hypothetical protein
MGIARQCTRISKKRTRRNRLSLAEHLFEPLRVLSFLGKRGKCFSALLRIMAVL